MKNELTQDEVQRYHKYAYKCRKLGNRPMSKIAWVEQYREKLANGIIQLYGKPTERPRHISATDWRNYRCCNAYRIKTGLPEISVDEYMAEHKGRQGGAKEPREIEVRRSTKAASRIREIECKADAVAIALRNREIVEKRLGIKLPTYR